MYWKKRAKIKWDSLGDQCTNFFFRSVKTRKGRNTIGLLKKEDGSWLRDEKEISDCFLNSNTQLFNPARSNQANLEEKRKLLRIKKHVGGLLCNLRGNDQLQKVSCPIHHSEKPKFVPDIIEGRSWNANKIWNLFERGSAQRILSTYLPNEEKEDEIVWLKEENSEYSIKSG
ncbi:Glycogen synthase 2 [Bienertia sinuspersici]